MRNWPWSTLGIELTEDRGAIRRAYSAKLKELDIDRQIAEYEELRAARDSALAKAAAMQAKAEGAAFGLGPVDYDDPAAPAYHGDHLPPADIHLDLAEDDPADGDEPQISGAFQQPSDERVEQAEEAWRTLSQLVFPEGQYSDEALWDYEFDSARDALTTLLDYSDAGEIGIRERLNYEISELLAQGWPRSAPMVPLAADAFDWRSLLGTLEEWPALAFLNARLAAMDFEAEIREPGHEFHNAWVELTAPTRPYWISSWFMKRQKLDHLIRLVDTRYPELRHQFDPQRAAKWEGETGTRTGWLVQAFVVVWILSAVVGRCAGFDDDEQGSSLPMPYELPQEETVVEDRDAIAADIFGEGTSISDVGAQDPVFMNQFSNMISRARYGTPVLAQMRGRLLRARNEGSFEDLVAIRTTQLAWLEAAEASRVETCNAVRQGNFAEIPPLFHVQRTAERHLSSQLLGKGLLSKVELGRDGFPVAEEERRFSVPGELIDRIIRETGLSEDRVSAALGDPTLPERCKVEIELLRAMVQRPGQVPDDLLRGL